MRKVALLISALFLPVLSWGAVTDTPADNPDLAELILPTQRIEFGLAKASSESGLLGWGGVDLRGGSRYDQADSLRWRLRWDELGFDTRTLQAELGVQGQYGFSMFHDQYHFLLSDDYQTPLSGAGSSRLTSPLTGLVRPSAVPGSAFNPFELNIERSRNQLGFYTHLNEQWTLRAGFQHELREGTKGTGALSGSVGGTAMILPEPIHQTLETLSLNLAYGQNRQHLQFAYTGSIFRNQIDQLDFQNPFTTGSLNNRLGVAPDNQLHQFKLDGGMNLSTATRLTGAWTKGRLTQNEAFLPYATSAAVATLPQNSLNGLVLTEHRFLQLTHRASRDLNLSANYRYDDRDNHTPINAYTRLNTEAGSTGTLSNSPYRRQHQQASLEADYALTRNLRWVVGQDQMWIQRSCRNTDERCVDSERSHEWVWRSEVRHTLNDWVSGRLGYRHGDRRVDDYAPLTAAADLSGMRKFIYADRIREQWWASSTILATEALAFNVRMDLNDDRYAQSRYGLDQAGGWGAHLDGHYTVTDEFSIYAYLSRQMIRSRLNNRYSKNAADMLTEQPNQAWLSEAQDRVDAIGFGFRHQGMMAGRVDLGMDLSLVETRNQNQLSGGGCTNSTCSSTLADLPVIHSRFVMLRSDVRYRLNDETTLRFFGAFSHLKNHDYAYEQYVYDTPTVASPTTYSKILNTYEAPGNYLGYFLGVSLIHQFR